MLFLLLMGVDLNEIKKDDFYLFNLKFSYDWIVNWRNFEIMI